MHSFEVNLTIAWFHLELHIYLQNKVKHTHKKTFALPWKTTFLFSFLPAQCNSDGRRNWVSRIQSGLPKPRMIPDKGEISGLGFCLYSITAIDSLWHFLDSNVNSKFVSKSPFVVKTKEISCDVWLKSDIVLLITKCISFAVIFGAEIICRVPGSLGILEEFLNLKSNADIKESLDSQWTPHISP